MRNKAIKMQTRQCGGESNSVTRWLNFFFYKIWTLEHDWWQMRYGVLTHGMSNNRKTNNQDCSVYSYRHVCNLQTHFKQHTVYTRDAV